MLAQSAQNTFAEKPAVSNMSGSLVLTGYYITEQSWLFLFNVGSGAHLRLAGQQWTGADLDWNTTAELNYMEDDYGVCMNEQLI